MSILSNIAALSGRADRIADRIEKAKGHVPPETVRNNAKRGLELRRKYGRGGLTNSEASEQGIGSGVQRASNLANGSALSLDTIKRMRAFFERHEKNKDTPPEEGNGKIAWLLWGGDAGRAWANSILRQEDLLRRIDALTARLEKADPRKTPAKPEERLEGSDKNPKGSASDTRGGIDLTDAIVSSLKAKADDHNGDVKDASRKASLGALKAVWRRGAGAFSTSHRPGVGRQQWAMARVNAYLTLLRAGKPANPAYVQDNDLLPEGHPRKSEVKKEAPAPGDVHVPSTEWGQGPKKKKKPAPAADAN